MHIPESLSGFIIWVCWHLVLIKGWIHSYVSSKPEEHLENVEALSEEYCSTTGAEPIDRTSRIRIKLIGKFCKATKTRFSGWYMGAYRKLLRRPVPVKREVQEISE